MIRPQMLAGQAEVVDRSLLQEVQREFGPCEADDTVVASLNYRAPPIKARTRPAD